MVRSTRNDFHIQKLGGDTFLRMKRWANQCMIILTDMTKPKQHKRIKIPWGKHWKKNTKHLMVIMNGPKKSLSEGFKLIHDVLRPTGFVLEPHAHNIQLDQETAYRYYESPWYDYEYYEFRTDAPGFGSEITDGIGGILLQYRKDFSFQLGICNNDRQYDAKDHYNNYFICVPYRSLRRLFEQDAIESLYQLILNIAEAVSVTVGFGDKDLAYYNLDEERTLHHIWYAPKNPGHPSSLGIICPAVFTGEKLAARARDLFFVKQSPGGYCLMISKTQDP